MKTSAARTMLVVCILAAGLAARIPMLDQSFWWDELWSTLPYAKASSMWQTVSDLGYYFNNHVLYSLLCRVSLAAFGESEITARLPSLVLGIAGMYAVYTAGSCFRAPQAGIIASLFVAISAFHVDHSTEARGYASLMFFSVLSAMSFIAALRSSTPGRWIRYGVVTFLGFYSHFFMCAVVGTQCLCALLLGISGSLRVRCIVPMKSLGFFLISAGITGCMVFIAYSPILHDLVTNLHKVRLVAVDRVPFLKDLAESLMPGSISWAGVFLYVPIFIMGIIALAAADLLVGLYAIILLTVPLCVYLAANPMFAFARYFITLLPVTSLALGAGITAFPRRFIRTPRMQWGGTAALVVLVTLLQLPSLQQILSRDRQNYRDAVRFAEEAAASGREGAVIMSVGCAGNHFQYYARTAIVMPKTFAEFETIAAHSPCVFALITAWLPDLRPPHEDVLLYTEDPEQTRIHDYILSRWTLVKTFPAKMPTSIYCSAARS